MISGLLEGSEKANARKHLRQASHTFVSRLAQRGASLKAIQDLLGHADLKMTMRYAHLGQNDLRDAVSVLSRQPKPSSKLAKVDKARERKPA